MYTPSRPGHKNPYVSIHTLSSPTVANFWGCMTKVPPLQNGWSLEPRTMESHEGEQPDSHQKMTCCIKPLKTWSFSVTAPPPFLYWLTWRSYMPEVPQKSWEGLYFTHGDSHSMFLLSGLFQILSLYEEIFLTIVPFPSTSELLSRSHFVAMCLFQREINQGLLRKEIVHTHYILV